MIHLVPPDPADAHDLTTLVRSLTLEDKVRLISGADTWSLAELPRIGLRALRMSDGPAGVRGVHWDERETSLLFPSPSATAATWDPEVARQVGLLMGAQARDKETHVVLAPTVNMHRSPLGGRHFECYSEDPLLTSRTAVAFIKGVQSTGVAATVKHFVANDSEDERMSYDSRVDERALREVYLAPFEAAVREARVWLVMSAYNSVNGDTMTENSRLQNDVLKGEWGFDGVVVSDWTAVRSTEKSYLGGTDVAMPGPAEVWTEPLIAAIRESRVDEAVLDDKVTRVLRLAARVGAFAGGTPGGTPGRTPSGTNTPADAEAQLRSIAARAMVLLENRDAALPLDASALRRVALIGPNAVRVTAQGGGSAHVAPDHIVGVPEGLRTVFGPEVELTVLPGAYTHRYLPGLPRDVIVDPVGGAPGVRVECRDADGTVLDTNVRFDPNMVFWPGTLADGTTVVAMSTRLTPVEDGTHLVEVLGAGSFTLTVDGREHQVRQAAESTDNIGVLLLRPPLTRIEVEARAGVPIDIELVFHSVVETVFGKIGMGWSPPRSSDDDALTEAVAAAAAADVAIVVVGTTDDIESESFDRTTLALPGRTDELVARVAEANPNTVVVVNAGAPVLMPWRDQVSAVVWAWLPGQEAGDAIADVLTGAVEPGGRLPSTIPADEQDVPVLSTRVVDGGIAYDEGAAIGYRLWSRRGTKPAYPFGYGLGYTGWHYDDAVVEGDADRGLTVDVTVTNTGARDGREVVQVYLEPADGTLFGAPEPLRLVGFTAVDIAAGATEAVRVDVSPDTLRRWDTEANGWTTVPGSYRLTVGRNAADPQATATVAL